MRSDGCWTPLDAEGQPTLERRRAVAADLDETFLACLNDEEFRKQMRRVLIAKYFVDFSERTALYQLVGLPVRRSGYIIKICGDAAGHYFH